MAFVNGGKGVLLTGSVDLVKLSAGWEKNCMRNINSVTELPATNRPRHFHTNL